jgi:hypothetical protein
VVRLHRVLNQAKPTPLPPLAKRAPEHVHAPLGPEVRHQPRDSERQMRRRPPIQLRPRGVSRTGTRAPFPTGAFASAAPGAEGEALLSRVARAHLNGLNLISNRVSVNKGSEKDGAGEGVSARPGAVESAGAVEKSASRAVTVSRGGWGRRGAAHRLSHSPWDNAREGRCGAGGVGVARCPRSPQPRRRILFLGGEGGRNVSLADL